MLRVHLGSRDRGKKTFGKEDADGNIDKISRLTSSGKTYISAAEECRVKSHKPYFDSAMGE